MEVTRTRGIREPWLALLLLASMCSWNIITVRVAEAQLGTWQNVVQNAGIASMHTAITHYDTAILLDRTNIGASQIALPNGQCRENNQERVLKRDCTAHSVMLGANNSGATNFTVRALFVQTDTWCSSGQFTADGTMVQTGGDYEGLYKIRRLIPCLASADCDWVESQREDLTDPRWYASNQLLPDGITQIVVGGRDAQSYEFVPKREPTEGAFALQLLADTKTQQGDNMYPFVHLLPDGNLFIFANRDSIVLNYVTDTVVKTFPTIPGEPRNYPSAGSSVMLPLDYADGFATAVEVVICGGAKANAFTAWRDREPASQTCGRIDVTAAQPVWVMEDMPVRRTMGDMVIMPTGDVLIVNGAARGSQGWGKAWDAVLAPVVYNVSGDAEMRFWTLAATTVPRVYHSTANLLSDGKILVAGSNSHEFYTLDGEFPTELRVETFSPPYLDARSDNIRPTITNAPGTITYGATFTITFTVGALQGAFEVAMLNAPFVTHSYAMGQRMLKLNVTAPVAVGVSLYTAVVTAPPNSTLAPPSYYMLFPVQNRIPGKAFWARIG